MILNLYLSWISNLLALWLLNFGDQLSHITHVTRRPSTFVEIQVGMWLLQVHSAGDGLQHLQTVTPISSYHKPLYPMGISLLCCTLQSTTHTIGCDIVPKAF